MHIENIIAITAVGLVVVLANGCSKRQSVAISLNADRGTNVATITTNGYTMMIGKTLGTNFTNNGSAGVKVSP